MNRPATAVREIGLPVFVFVTSGVILYPELLTLVRGDPLGAGISDIVVGILSLSLYACFESLDRISKADGLDVQTERWASIVLLTAAAAINVVVISAVPDSPEALGMLLVCVAGIVVMLVNAPADPSSS